MGSIVSGVTDAVGLTDSKAGKRAEASAREASELQADYQREALEYLKQQEEVPSAVKESALQQMAGAYGLPGYDADVQTQIDQAQLVQQAQESPLYSALMGGQQAAEEAVLRQAGATGGLRSGNVQAALAEQTQNLQNQALLQSYQEQRGIEEANIQRQLGGLSGLAGLGSYAPQIAQQMGGIGQTLGQGIVGGTQARLAGEAQTRADQMALIQSGAQMAAMFSDARLKDNVEPIGEDNGYPIYRWTWNERANWLGLYGDGYGVIADEVESIRPEAVSFRDGYKTVDYGMIGVSNG